MNRDVERGVATGTAVASAAGVGLVLALMTMNKEQRFKTVKVFAFLFCAFLAAACAVVSLGLFNELAQIPVAEKGLATGVAVFFAMPAVGVVGYALKKLLRK